MKVPVIMNEADHKRALKRIETLVRENQKARVPELEALSLLVENYEKIRWPMEAPDPIQVLEFCMAELGVNQSGLAGKLQMSRNRMSEVLNRKRPLTLDMIRTMIAELGLPSDVLVREYDLETKPKGPLLSR